MNILVIGSGGREHAICYALKKSCEVERLFCVPGNPGIAQIAECPKKLCSCSSDWNAIADFAVENKIGLVVIGPEVPLCDGASDIIRSRGIPVFGPSKEAAQLEGSKEFSKNFMKKYGIPTADYQVFSSCQNACDYVNSQYDKGKSLVIKADGLAAGKGVIVAQSREEALSAVKSCFDGLFGTAGSKVVIEECLIGEEASILALTDGHNILPLASSQDHKRQLDNDLGPNTGGMGAYSPAPVVTDSVMKKIQTEVLERFLTGIQNEKLDYRGLIYAGVMITKDGPKVLEFNVRFGDPETEAVLIRLKSSFLDALYKTANGHLDEVNLEWKKEVGICVVLASGEYPSGKVVKGHVISGIEDAEKQGAIVFHAGTALDDNSNFTNAGGRVLVVAKTAPTIQTAINSIYQAVRQITWDNMQYRKDIAQKAIIHVGND